MTIFHDPREFLKHLHAQSQLPLTPEQSKTLLLASTHVIQYLLDSQNLLSQKMILSVDCLNSNHDTWGHKLSELYEILEAGKVDAHTMNLILHKEICNGTKDS